MSKYYRVSYKICKSTVIDEISSCISNTKKEISDVHNNIVGLNSPRNCFLYGDSIEDFENLLVSINQALVKLNEKFSYFVTGLEEIENSSSQQINEIEIPTIHNAELHNVEFSVPPVSDSDHLDTPISYEQQNPIYENFENQDDTSTNFDSNVQLEENNMDQEVMSDTLQDSNNDELIVSSRDSDNNYSDLSNNDSFNIEFENSDELSFPEVEIKEDEPVLDNVSTPSNTQKTEHVESNNGINATLVGGIAAAIGAVGAGAAFTYSNKKKDEEKDDDSQRGD